jgi:hypothetical protein
VELTNYKKAAFPCVCVETCEEERFTAEVLAEFAASSIYSIAAVGGLRDLRAGSVDAAAQYGKAVAYAAGHDDCVLIVLDFQAIIRNPGSYRMLREAFQALKARGSMIVLVAPSWSLPAEVAHDIPILQYALPERAQLQAALTVVAESAGVAVSDPGPLLDAAAGLTLGESENAFALSLVRDKAFLPRTIEAEKMRLVRSSGYLEVSQVAPIDSVGGLHALKDYITQELMPSKADPLLRVRGVLLVGVPGTGKSLCSRAAGSLLQWPVLRMDMSGLKGSLVGQSEANLRGALKLADAVAPCILWLDEIEKAVGGYASSAQSDGGTTLGMVGALLTWMQEHTSPVVVLATCNDYKKLPTELTRAGRFDERFFVDLPSSSERAEIARVHLLRFCSEPNGLCEQVSALSDGWTGAEIEQLIKSAARRSGRTVTGAILAECARDIKPISRVRADEITALREWARDSLRMANTPETAVTGRAVKR